MEQKILEGRKLIALFYFLLCTLQITINRRVVNKYYSDLGMWNRRYRHEILFLLLSLCWWSSGHFSLVCVIAELFIFYSLEELLCVHSSYVAALHCFQHCLVGMICGPHQLSVCALFRSPMNIRLTAISYVLSTEMNKDGIFICSLALWKANSLYLLHALFHEFAHLL